MIFKYLILTSILTNFFYCSSYNLQAIVDALCKDDVKVIKEAIEEGFDINQLITIKDTEEGTINFHTSLTYAVNHSAINVIKLLISKNVDVNKLCSSEFGYSSPLSRAYEALNTSSGNLQIKNEIIDLLIKNGAKTSSQNLCSIM